MDTSLNRNSEQVSPKSFYAREKFTLIIVFAIALSSMRAACCTTTRFFDLEEPQEEDYCSATGNVCVYHKVCYDVDDVTWKNPNDPPTNAAPLLNKLGNTETSEGDRHSNCNEEFSPKKAETPTLYDSKADSLIVHGTTYYVWGESYRSHSYRHDDSSIS